MRQGPRSYRLALMLTRWNQRTAIELVLTVIVLGAVMIAYSHFVQWVEHRPGVVLPDPVLALFAPRNVTWLIFMLVYSGLLIAIVTLAWRPSRLLLGLQSYAAMLLLRIVAMWLVPLDPPHQMLPLEDPLVQILGPSSLLTKDLFFSGHTASLFVLSLAAPSGWLRNVLLSATALIACCVLLQHIHYSIDVLAALAFSFMAVTAANKLRAQLGLVTAG